MIELRADPSRVLRVADPQARELVISCGAALYTLELAIRGVGLEPRTQLLPDDNDPELLARVRGLPGARATREERALLSAIKRRHTHRGAFTDRRPSSGLLADLRSAAHREGAHLTVIDDATADRLTDLAWNADRQQQADLAWRAEMAKWSNRPGRLRRDGVPVEAYPETPPPRDGNRLPGRDFALRRRWGRGQQHDPGEAVLALITTDTDNPRAWLRAGKALQHVLLLAADQWVFANFATQPLELPDVRAAVRAAMNTTGYPQMLFHLGHARTAALTARRPVRQVLDSELSDRSAGEDNAEHHRGERRQ